MSVGKNICLAVDDAVISIKKKKKQPSISLKDTVLFR